MKKCRNFNIRPIYSILLNDMSNPCLIAVSDVFTCKYNLPFLVLASTKKTYLADHLNKFKVAFKTFKAAHVTRKSQSSHFREKF